MSAGQAVSQSFDCFVFLISWRFWWESRDADLFETIYDKFLLEEFSRRPLLPCDDRSSELTCSSLMVELVNKDCSFCSLVVLGAALLMFSCEICTTMVVFWSPIFCSSLLVICSMVLIPDLICKFFTLYYEPIEANLPWPLASATPWRSWFWTLVLLFLLSLMVAN